MSGSYSVSWRVFALVLAVICCCGGALADSTFGDPTPVNTNADSDVELDGNPSVAGDGDNLVAVWSSSNTQGNGIGTDGDIYEAHSSDGGATWSDPAPLTADDAADQTPVVATDGAGNWVVAWASTNDLGGTINIDYDILFSRSTNNGQTWSTPTFLNSLAPTSNASDFDIQIAAGGPDLFIAVWASNSNVGTGSDNEVHFARSKDGGGSWNDEDALNPDSDSDSRYDQQPSVASDGNGNWVAIWLGEGEDSIYDVLTARSTNDGKTWKDQQTAGSGSGLPRVTTDGAGNWVAIWHLLDPAKGLADDDNDIVTVHSSNDGGSWSTPEFVNSTAETDAHNDQKPTITTDGAGTWLATWSSTNPLDGGDPADFDIHTARSKDNGVSWSTVKQLHSNAATDLGTDINSGVVAKGADDWFVAWESYESFSGTLGSDADIISARAFPSSYTITNPNGGEEWKIGKKGTIEWDSTVKAGKVKLILLKDGTAITTIKSKTKDDGSFKWEVPAGIGTGNNFRVRIEAKNDSTDADESDGNFKVKSGK